MNETEETLLHRVRPFIGAGRRVAAAGSYVMFAPGSAHRLRTEIGTHERHHHHHLGDRSAARGERLCSVCMPCTCTRPDRDGQTHQ
ncbi:hypothetical protein [Streptomyces sp. NPDC090445]|uniref:hypothetical protein n=1 Tax=Streptomyces sp. NPDC090445 TaxID=3365963 RepID=UPI0038206771